MAEKVTIEVEADVKEALQKLGDIDKGVKDIGITAKKQNSALKGLANGFKGVGLAMKAAGIGIVLKVVDQLGQALMRNQEAADAVSTAFNMVGIVFNKIISTIKTVFDRVTATTENFDALGRLIKNLMTLALTPLKLTFNSVALVIKEVQLAWEKSWLGKGDVKRIQELTNQINGYKQEIKEAAEEAIASGKGIIVDFREGIGEISNMGRATVQAFNNTFKGVTINTIKEQAEAVTQATSNLSLLEAAHQRIIVEFETQAEQQRAIRDDITKSIDDRLAANKELLRISQEQADAEVKAINEQIGALRTQMEIEVDSKELKAQIFALQTQAIEAEKRKTALAKESVEQENALTQERIDNQNQLDQILKDSVQLQIETINQEEEARKQLARRTISDKKELEETLSKIEKDAGQKRNQVEQALQDQRRQIVGSALSGLTALVGEETKAGKGIAVAQATIDTFTGATKALAQGGIFGTIAAAGVIAAGLTNVRNILQTEIPGESGGGAVPSVEQGANLENTVPVAPTFGAITTEPPPVQAFVVESDVSSSQALQNDLNLQATL
jgi:hypothetical protein|tara:strand:- start:93 stop:1769 length:1677 start_codon:yes stop_codon:yes gene_type:complete